MSKIFISYSRADEEFARKLARSLSEMGAQIWLDVNDIPAGMKWSTAIQQGLNVCQIMLLIISPESMASSNVEDEWQYYLDKKKPIIPLLYKPADKHFQINRLQHVDFHTVSYHIAFDRLLHELQSKGVSIQQPLNDQEDVLYEEAVEMVRRLGRASVSLLQSRLRLDHARSTSLIDRMEKEAVIGPLVEGAKSHMVLPISSAPFPAPSPDTILDWSPVVDSFFSSLAQDEPAPGTRMTDDKGIEMVYVPAGKFLMGSNDREDEKPVHEVQIAHHFWLDLTPVTNEAYALFIEDGGYKTRNWWTKLGWDWVQSKKAVGPHDFDKFTDSQQPRIGVTWFEANAYASWRGGRLPTEAEWEWAARGPENRLYPWGNNFDANRVIFKDNSGGKTAVVRSGIRTTGTSWVGALDMCGNVWEWVSSLYKSYPYSADDGREKIETDIMDTLDSLAAKRRVFRGGSWVYSKPDLHLSRRDGLNPSYEVNAGGFRCVRAIN